MVDVDNLRFNPSDSGASGSEAHGSAIVELRRAADLVQLLLFVTEYVCGARLRKQVSVAPLVFFLGRSGGVRLLTHLLNAAYNKPIVGRPGGWPFNVLLNQVGISERALRMLLRDACAEGLVEKSEFELDKRYAVYCVTEVTVCAWEKMYSDLQGSVVDVLDHLAPGDLANIDYKSWDPTHCASEQVQASPVARHLKSAANRLALQQRLPGPKTLGGREPRHGASREVVQLPA